jgi:predicted DNA-binding ribbon-helix-helix protein
LGANSEMARFVGTTVEFGADNDEFVLNANARELPLIHTDTYLNDLLVISSLKTSVSMENEFWESLKEIARGRGMTVSELVGIIDSTRINGNLSSTLRLFVLDFDRSKGSSELQLANAPASNAALERPGS